MSETLPVPIQVIEPKKRKRGRQPRPVFDQSVRQLVRDMATWGVPLKAMRQHVRHPVTGEPVAESLLSEEFADELAQGTALGDAALARNLWLQANGRPAEFGEVNGKMVKLREELRPQPGPAIFLSKVRLGYRETSVVEHRNFNLNVFHQMKDELRKVAPDDLTEIGQEWQARRQRASKPRKEVRSEPDGAGSGA